MQDNTIRGIGCLVASTYSSMVPPNSLGLPTFGTRRTRRAWCLLTRVDWLPEWLENEGLDTGVDVTSQWDDDARIGELKESWWKLCEVKLGAGGGGGGGDDEKPLSIFEWLEVDEIGDLRFFVKSLLYPGSFGKTGIPCRSIDFRFWEDGDVWGIDSCEFGCEEASAFWICASFTCINWQICISWV